MASRALDRLLTELESLRFRFDRGAAACVLQTLNKLSRASFPDCGRLIRLHEALMFLRAFPQSPAVLRRVEALLTGFHLRVDALRRAGVDLSDLDPLEVSGMAGTQMEDTLSFDLARWLVKRMPGQMEVNWEDCEDARALAATWPRLMPLLEDDAYVEADTPWRRWLEKAQGNKSSSPEWLLNRIAELPISVQERAELYGSLRLPLRWKLNNSRLSRTRNWERPRRVFYHQGPLISRSEVSLAEELAAVPPKLERVSLQQGRKVIDRIREVMLVRYRELYGTTLGDPASVLRADMGRGVVIYLWNLLSERRLPLRAYVAGLGMKNGVPFNYIEAIGLCEWMEVGFNTFYTFRGGEAGWVYAQVLRCLCTFMGTTCVSVYPYQLGHDNDEAIESGAFWFYRKLGFRPGRKDVAALLEREERKVASDPKYRTPARTLRRLAEGHVFYELPGSDAGAWATFSTRNIGLKVNALMARNFGGNRERMCAACSRRLARILRVNPSRWNPLELSSFETFAFVLALAPDLAHWSSAEKRALLQIIRAKADADEMKYLHLMQRHSRLRETLLKLGS